MIYIESDSSILIPRHTYIDYGSYTLILTSNMSNPTTIVNGMSNISANTFYYKFQLSIPDSLPYGEYTYTLYNEDNLVVETGLLTYGNFDRTGLVSKNTSQNKIQYNG